MVISLPVGTDYRRPAIAAGDGLLVGEGTTR